MVKVSKIRSQQLNTPVTKTKAALNIEEVARLEVGETPETKADSLLRLRQLLEGEPSLKIPSSDDLLVMFLRARKYRVEEAAQMVKNYFRARRDLPEFFHELVPEKVPFRTICHDHKLLMISPEPGECGRCMAVVKVGAWSPDICSLLDFTRAGILLSGSRLLEDVPSICGIECVLDMKGLNIHHLTQLTPSYLMKLANITQVHFIGGEASEFWGRFPGDLVPAVLGGRREQFDYDRQEKFVHSSSAFFESLCTCGYRNNKT
ncbi:alpha-tocopherol transfer protein-like isoform X2 [Dermacentor albipictus]|uniref:alpha-tocopherol transfer protein-like isoform X2 n=1 Tax=Dermacentor albipictus TaxID=60249 RepID=UPI0038FCF3C0